MSELTDIQPAPTPAPTEVVAYDPSPVVHQTTPVGAVPLASERVILESPMSFVGSARRIWRWAEGDRSGWVKVGQYTLAVIAILLWWCVVASWYAFTYLFFWIVIPWRLYRRSQRKDQRAALQHREVLEQLKRGQG